MEKREHRREQGHSQQPLIATTLWRRRRGQEKKGAVLQLGTKLPLAGIATHLESKYSRTAAPAAALNAATLWGAAEPAHAQNNMKIH